MSLLLKIFDLPIIGRIIKHFAVKWSGKQQKSKVLRQYTLKKYKTEVGLYSYGGCFSPQFNNGGTVTIGRYCSFAQDVRYFGANHPLNYVSTSSYFYNKSFGFDVKDVKREHLLIGNDVWCGYGVIITSSCHSIGNGSVIAAGAVVTKDIPPYAVVAGVPAKIIKYRFDEDTILRLEQSEWWKRPPEKLVEYYKVIDKPVEFCNGISGGGIKNY